MKRSRPFASVAFACLVWLLVPLLLVASLCPNSRAGYLNPNTGRFWTMDSFEGSESDPLSLHKYLYAQANPVTMADPSGQYSIIEVGIASTISATLRAIWELRGVLAKQVATAKIYDVYVGFKFSPFPWGHSGIFVYNRALKGLGSFFDIRTSKQLGTFNPFATQKGSLEKERMSMAEFQRTYTIKIRFTKMNFIQYIFWQASNKFLVDDIADDANQSVRIPYSLFGNAFPTFRTLAGDGSKAAYSCHSWTFKAAVSAFILSKVK
ncbi:MAG: hypothetical protein HOP33_23085 [Verrucomicrobia bacterium]|nr:hypothetical protein [Verrucomicrobiota bacterium]